MSFIQKNHSSAKIFLPVLCLSFLLTGLFTLPLKAADNLIEMEQLRVDKVWAGHPVNFAITTVDDFQCIAYYDTTRKMVVASRNLDDTTWNFTTLPSTTGWDSHNYIEMAIDDSGYVHVSGNMHNARSLIYFRSKKPWNTESFTSPGMVGYNEGSVTYPIFIKGLANQLIFQFRDGGSGSGTTYWNSYDLKTKKWSRLTNRGLFDGEGQVNAYQTSPVAGPDGFFHVIWMWRETPVANTNFHLSHIKSKDLVKWETMAGTPLSIPVKQSTAGVVVDPIQSGRGLINMDFWISWDTHDRAVCTYHRYDDRNISQIFNTRWEYDAWKIYQTSSWTSFKWNLDLQGSLTHDIAADPLMLDETGSLIQKYIYRNDKTRRWVLDEETLTPEKDGEYEPPRAMNNLYTLESSFPGIQVNTMRDGEYYLKWETMPINQDRSRPTGSYPSSSILRLFRYSTATKSTNHITRTADFAFRVEQHSRYITVYSADGTPFSGKASLHTIDGRCLSRSEFTHCSHHAIQLVNFYRGVVFLRIRSKNGTSGIIRQLFMH